MHSDVKTSSWNKASDKFIALWCRHYYLHLGPPALLWQRATPVIVSWFAGRTWTNNNKWSTQPPKLLYNFCSIYIIYKCGRGPRVWDPWPTLYVHCTFDIYKIIGGCDSGRQTDSPTRYLPLSTAQEHFMKCRTTFYWNQKLSGCCCAWTYRSGMAHGFAYGVSVLFCLWALQLYRT
jgi:hypothetical protein